jgi:hypothetical protein
MSFRANFLSDIPAALKVANPAQFCKFPVKFPASRELRSAKAQEMYGTRLARIMFSAQRQSVVGLPECNNKRPETVAVISRCPWPDGSAGFYITGNITAGHNTNC